MRFGLAWVFALWSAGCGPGASSPGDGEGSAATTEATTTAVDDTSATSGSGPVGTDAGTDGSPGDATTTTEDGGDTTGAPWTSCLGLPGEPITTLEGAWAVYEGCEGEYVIEHQGAVLADDLGEIVDASTLSFDAGITAFGVGLCCDSPMSCINLQVHAFELSLDELLAVVSDGFADVDDQCFGLRVMLSGLSEPRCDPAVDPECLPIAVCEGSAAEACCGQPEYDPNGPRIPVADDLSEGACEHDGWCVLGGSGGTCQSIEVPNSAGFVICTDEISQAHCGCVRGQCHWFVQQ